ncbi:MAG: universal stress protein [Bacteroidetes bacterium]|nr:universal stress protein [Bacteroidota bacterium]
MIKKIICPVDFSEAAINGIEYAAKFAQACKAELHVINVQSLFPEAVISGENMQETMQLASDKLKAVCHDVSSVFQLSCSYDLEVTNSSLGKVIAKESEGENVIVMGTNGIDDIYQYLFGTNTFNVIKKSQSPVLLVPETISYRNIKKIVFAWDYTPRNKATVLKLKDIVGVFRSEVIFLQISRQFTNLNSDVYKISKEELASFLAETPNVKFDNFYSDELEEGIDHYMLRSNADLLAITFHQRNLLSRILHHSIVQEISTIASYPVLILPA